MVGWQMNDDFEKDPEISGLPLISREVSSSFPHLSYYVFCYLFTSYHTNTVLYIFWNGLPAFGDVALLAYSNDRVGVIILTIF
jgi:hypothetical protein